MSVLGKAYDVFNAEYSPAGKIFGMFLWRKSEIELYEGGDQLSIEMGDVPLGAVGRESLRHRILSLATGIDGKCFVLGENRQLDDGRSCKVRIDVDEAQLRFQMKPPMSGQLLLIPDFPVHKAHLMEAGIPSNLAPRETFQKLIEVTRRPSKAQAAAARYLAACPDLTITDGVGSAVIPTWDRWERSLVARLRTEANYIFIPS